MSQTVVMLSMKKSKGVLGRDEETMLDVKFLVYYAYHFNYNYCSRVSCLGLERIVP